MPPSQGDLSMSDGLVTTRMPVIESGPIASLAEEPMGAFGAEPLRDRLLDVPIAPAPGLIGRAARAGLMLSVHSELAAIEPEWRAFERTAAATAFQSFDWLAKRQRDTRGPAGDAAAGG